MLVLSGYPPRDCLSEKHSSATVHGVFNMSGRLAKSCRVIRIWSGRIIRVALHMLQLIAISFTWYTQKRDRHTMPPQTLKYKYHWNGVHKKKATLIDHVLICFINVPSLQINNQTCIPHLVNGVPVVVGSSLSNFVLSRLNIISVRATTLFVMIEFTVIWSWMTCWKRIFYDTSSSSSKLIKSCSGCKKTHTHMLVIWFLNTFISFSVIKYIRV